MFFSSTIFPFRRAAVLRNGDLGFRIFNAARQRIDRETAINNGMDRAYLGACQHCNLNLGHAAHVDGYAVALGHAKSFEYIGELIDLAP